MLSFRFLLLRITNNPIQPYPNTLSILVKYWFSFPSFAETFYSLCTIDSDLIPSVLLKNSVKRACVCILAALI